MSGPIKKWFGIVAKYILVPFSILCILAIAFLLSYRTYLQHQIRKETDITSPGGIQSLEKVVLGGVEQQISIRGQDRSNPVLLHLHGGPGGAEIPLARFFDTELEKHFVVVKWDQRGAGMSYDPDIPVESLSTEQLISDAHEMAELLRKRLGVEKMYLVGHSWGSALGARTASLYPELFHAFVGVGQFVEDVELEEISYNFTLDKAKELNNQEALEQLEEIGPPPYDHYDEMLVQRVWLERFGGLYHGEMGNLFMMGATSPDSTLFDGYRYTRGQMFVLEHMWDDLKEVNLFEQAPRIEVPVYFFLGRHDYNTPPELAVRYFEMLEAPAGKQIVWFENAGHMIPFEASREYSDALINKVLKETSTPAP